ncbi:signal peptidase I [Sphingorhabdus lutea]|uniref:Signal peptidase I n=1 Tax=Sphingorhabdus lutea TaxID=1913578 RepID=A0A1L3JF14_9SPHN|nr:signal peptidase I [Sphingorhabdus lutea]APG63689.1 signal peptidase I [Sphingorhabdus lutea]
MQSKNGSEWVDFGKFLIKLIIFMALLRTFFFAPFNIPSESMQPRLLIGDYLVVSKWSYGYSKNSVPFQLPIIPGRIFASDPKAGDVVVFKAPPTARDDYIKRVIGLPGDQIQMIGGILHINGTAVPKKKIADLVIPVTQNMIDASIETDSFPCFSPQYEEKLENGQSQCRYPQFEETLPNGRKYKILDVVADGRGDDSQAFIVPEGHVFLMGDNRDRSEDSRWPAVEGGAIGIVPMENLVGKAWFSVFSTDGSASWIMPWTWFSATRAERIGEGF